MYIPLLISIEYILVSNHKQVIPLNIKQIQIVFRNLLISELLYLISIYTVDLSQWRWINFPIILFVQDLYFYFIHMLFHKVSFLYEYHKLHHSSFSPFLGWYSTIIEHIVLNLGSFAIPIFIFPIHSHLITLLIIMQVYTSVNGHASNSKHEKHHLDHRKRLGSIYLFDRLFGSF
jgi:sterol desaturase/sphingolipid hydroxylase (fatty acid hydroxylase superfamily)